MKNKPKTQILWTLALLLLVAPSSFATAQYEEEEEWSRSFDIGPNGSFALSNISGDLVIRGGAGEQVQIQAVKEVHRAGSDAEANRYTQHVTDAHEPIVVGNGVDLDRFKPGEPTQDPVITFTGVMSYKPNVDAVIWFARQVMPRIRAAVPGARFDIVGKSPSSLVHALDELPGVRVVGPVASTADSLRAPMLAVAPMKIAALTH